MATRLQAKLKKDGITEVRFLITHPMETGARQSVKTGKKIPAHFVKELKCEYDGKVVMEADWSPGVSTNPYCAFRFKGGEVGKEVTLTWKDRKETPEKPETEEVVTALIKEG